MVAGILIIIRKEQEELTTALVRVIHHLKVQIPGARFGSIAEQYQVVGILELKLKQPRLRPYLKLDLGFPPK